MNLSDLLHTSYLGNDVATWALAAVAAVLAAVLLRALRALIRHRLRSLAGRTKTALDDVLVDTLAATHSFTFVAAGVYAGSLSLSLAPNVRIFLDRGFVLVVLVQAALWGNRALASTLERYRADESLDSGRRTTLAALGFIGRLVLFALVVFMALENLGIRVTTLIAGLGITSLAVALALQNILGDLFASLSIVFDKPFEIGDFIIVGDHMGSVEHVGLRSTRVRSLSGEQLVFANNDLLTSRIQNYKRMQERRVVFGFGVTYQTPREQLARIPDIVKGLVEGQEKLRFDRSHFKGFGPYSLDFETVYYVLESDYYLYMDTQQAINLGLMDAFAEAGIEFAFPTQTLFLEHAAAGFGNAPVPPDGKSAS